MEIDQGKFGLKGHIIHLTNEQSWVIKFKTIVAQKNLVYKNPKHFADLIVAHISVKDTDN